MVRDWSGIGPGLVRDWSGIGTIPGLVLTYGVWRVIMGFFLGVWGGLGGHYGVIMDSWGGLGRPSLGRLGAISVGRLGVSNGAERNNPSFVSFFDL